MQTPEQEEHVNSLIQSLMNPHKANHQKTIKLTVEELEQEQQMEDLLSGLTRKEEMEVYCHRYRASNVVRSKLQKWLLSSELEQPEYGSFLMLASQACYLKLHNAGYYQNLLTMRPEYPPNFFTTIDKDIPRTLPDGHPLQSGLRDILYAYAMRNPSLLYCQGLNYIVAYLLMNSLSDEEVFWFMTALIENILPQDYFRDLKTIGFVVEILNRAVRIKHPWLSDQMGDIGIEGSMHLISWYACLFTKGFTNAVSHFMLSRLILGAHHNDVGFVILELSLAMVQSLAERLHKAYDLIVPNIDNYNPTAHFDPRRLFNDTVEQLTMETPLAQFKAALKEVSICPVAFEKLRVMFDQLRSIRKKQMMKKQKQVPFWKLPACNPLYPICLHRLQLQKKMTYADDVIIMRVGEEIKGFYDSNYFSPGSQPKRDYQPMQCARKTLCLVTRHTHVCFQKKTPPQPSQNDWPATLMSEKTSLEDLEVVPSTQPPPVDQLDTVVLDALPPCAEPAGQAESEQTPVGSSSNLSRMSTTLQLSDMVKLMSHKLIIDNQAIFTNEEPPSLTLDDQGNRPKENSILSKLGSMLTRVFGNPKPTPKAAARVYY